MQDTAIFMGGRPILGTLLPLLLLHWSIVQDPAPKGRRGGGSRGLFLQIQNVGQGGLKLLGGGAWHLKKLTKFFLGGGGTWCKKEET